MHFDSESCGNIRNRASRGFASAIPEGLKSRWVSKTPKGAPLENGVGCRKLEASY
jgi:hypothetical protein